MNPWQRVRELRASGKTAAWSTPYGFQFGATLVERRAELPEGRVVIGVTTEFRNLEIYVSQTGRSVRVFEKGKELTRDGR